MQHEYGYVTTFSITLGDPDDGEVEIEVEVHYDQGEVLDVDISGLAGYELTEDEWERVWAKASDHARFPMGIEDSPF